MDPAADALDGVGLYGTHGFEIVNKGRDVACSACIDDEGRQGRTPEGGVDVMARAVEIELTSVLERGAEVVDAMSERARQTQWGKYRELSEKDRLISAMCAEGVVLLQEGSRIYGRSLTKRVPGGKEFEGVMVKDVTTLADVQYYVFGRGRHCHEADFVYFEWHVEQCVLLQ